MTPYQILLYAQIIEACREGRKVHVVDEKTGDAIEGVARHIVEPDSCVFATQITPECRLRVTSMMDVFIPLKNITEQGFYVE